MRVHWIWVPIVYIVGGLTYPKLRAKVAGKAA